MRRRTLTTLALIALAVVVAAAPVSLAGVSGPTPDATPGPGSVVPGENAVKIPSRNAVGTDVRAATVVTVGNTTAYLAVPTEDIETVGYRRAPLDVPGAVALDAAALDNRLDQQVGRERFDGIESSISRRARVRASAAEIETRIDALRRRQTTAISAFNNGLLSQRSFVRRLALIDTTAGDLATAISRLKSHASSVPGVLIDGEVVSAWARDRRLALAPFRGPIRDRLADTIHTAVDPPPIYVETTGEGVVLAATFGGRYHREAVLPSERIATTNTTATNTTATTPNERTPTGVSEALDRITQLYPAAWLRNTDSTGSRGAGLSRVTLFHDRGRVQVYFDRDTGAVFAEQQRTLLAAVPTVEAATNATDALELRVNRTYPTGPLELDVADPLTHDPLNASLTVDGVGVGDTGPDGQLWTIQPRGAFTVTAHRANESVRVAVNATANKASGRTAEG